MAETNDVVATIAAVIAPYVGTTMASTAVQAQARKLGFDGHMSPEQVEALLARLGGGLTVFVGREKSVAIVEEARQALGRRSGS